MGGCVGDGAKAPGSPVKGREGEEGPGVLVTDKARAAADAPGEWGEGGTLG